jgi:hypothetical protein
MFFQSSSKFWLLFTMFVTIESNFDAIYNVFLSSSQFLMRFTMWFALHVHLRCYLQRFLLLKAMFDADYNVFRS